MDVTQIQEEAELKKKKKINQVNHFFLNYG